MKEKAYLYKIMRPVSYWLFRIVYNPTIVNERNIPAEGRCVIAGNHKHALDPILVDCCTKRVVHTLAKKDLHDGIFGWFFRAIGTIPVDLHAEHNRDALEQAVDYLNNDALINLSPEAKRNYTDEILLPFKYGAVVMAKRTGSMIVPYSITGDYKFGKNNLKIVFGDPIDVSKLDVEEANKLLFDKVKKLIIENRENV
ncbi:1-acyl-sn-glycerol-3-phosphate acyltransferase [Butyrivibrio sp. X503]|uniref:lysophospholipid acyltransferase family protein n=1 Tax=Butyrivibrio sp. X503 TaxID=2364878 RepID=UPI000EA9B529|nr:lysophospholipid acyltransferase family protein [Butyrivibrio sp. X503]RKM56354.1 1-acyl-sn-glycerol-3-phosphate acyltransferase [Butyrivibrio sp. X503]